MIVCLIGDDWKGGMFNGYVPNSPEAFSVLYQTRDILQESISLQMILPLVKIFNDDY